MWVFCMYVCVHMCVYTSVCRCSSYMHELEATVIIRCLSLLHSIFFWHRVSYWSWNSPIQLGFLGSELLASPVSNSPALGLQVYITVPSFGCECWGSELKASCLHLRTLYTRTTPAPMMHFGPFVCVKNLYLGVLYLLLYFVVIAFWPTDLCYSTIGWKKTLSFLHWPESVALSKKQIAVLVESILVLLSADTCLSLPWEQPQVPSYRTSLACPVVPSNYSSHVNLKSLWISTEKLTVLFDVICIKV